MAFKYRPGVNRSYREQALIWSISANYEALAKSQQETIRKLCEVCGHGNARALFEFVTTDAKAEAVCMKNNIASVSALYRIAREYYEHFPIKKMVG